MGNKPKRIDYERIEYVGRRLLSYPNVAATSTTITEDHEPADLYVTNTEGKVLGIEVKTCRMEYNSTDKLYPLKNSCWFYVPKDLDPKKRYWMLNAIDGQGIGKVFQLTEAWNGLVYLFKDGLLWFGPDALYDARAGLGIYYTSQRMEFEAGKRKPGPQCKMLIDLSYGKWIPDTPPEELFNSTTHNDFNRENSK